MKQNTKDWMQYGSALFLILIAVTLAFVSFIVTLTIGTGVLGWGALSLSAALAIFGVGMYFQNQFITLETKLKKSIKERLDEEIEETKKQIDKKLDNTQLLKDN